MDFERLEYISGDGSQHYDFVFMDCGPIGWRIYIINRIRYGFRKKSSHAAHWLKMEGETYKYICWEGKINTLEQAKAVASLWADATAQYIKYGSKFDDIVARLMN